jgi:hypothetical protein
MMFEARRPSTRPRRGIAVLAPAFSAFALALACLVATPTSSPAQTPTPAPAELTNVLLVAADTPAWVVDVQSKISGTELISGSVDIFDATLGTPTLAQLQAYQAVLFWGDACFQNNVLLGDVLADYVDAGGGAVQMTFTMASVGCFTIAGRWRSGGYDPLIPDSYTSGLPLTLGTIHQPGHPILSGVSSLSGGSSSYHNTVVGVSAETIRVADWSNGRPLIAANTVSFTGRTVALNFFPPSSDERGDFWDSTTDGARLMANALGFVAGVASGPTPTPTATPAATPTATPTAISTPTASPTPTPIASPTPTPIATPTATPIASPTPTPIATPTATPMATPTAISTPTASPTPTPIATPTATPTASPTATPTLPPPPPAGAQPDGLVWVYHSEADDGTPGCASDEGPCGISGGPGDAINLYIDGGSDGSGEGETVCRFGEGGGSGDNLCGADILIEMQNGHFTGIEPTIDTLVCNPSCANCDVETGICPLPLEPQTTRIRMNFRRGDAFAPPGAPPVGYRRVATLIVDSSGNGAASPTKIFANGVGAVGANLQLRPIANAVEACTGVGEPFSCCSGVATSADGRWPCGPRQIAPTNFMPEPGQFLQLVSGLAGLGCLYRLRRRA